MKTYLTIDPGTNGTGWAVWSTDWILFSHGVLSAPNKLKWEEKMRYIAKEIKKIAEKNKVTKAFIEFPQKFHGVAGDMVANKGDLVKLAAFVGYVQGYLDVIDIPSEEIRVIDWKGQLPKDVVILRIKRLLPDCKATTHDWDAIGIGLYKKGVF